MAADELPLTVAVREGDPPSLACGSAVTAACSRSRRRASAARAGGYHGAMVFFWVAAEDADGAG